MNITRAIVESGFELVELLVKESGEQIYVSREVFSSLLKGRGLKNQVRKHSYALGPDELVEEYVFQSPVRLSFQRAMVGKVRA